MADESKGEGEPTKRDPEASKSESRAQSRAGSEAETRRDQSDAEAGDDHDRDAKGSSEPPPPAAGSKPSGGIDAKSGGVLAYAFWWISGAIMLFVGKNDPDVKYHGAQSVVVLGGLWLAAVVLGQLFSLFKFGIVGVILYLVAITYWIIFIVRVIQEDGARFEAPFIGRYTTKYVEQLADAVK